MKNPEHSIEQVIARLKAENVRRRRSFTTSVMSISEDHSSVKVKLCTGGVIDVPISIVKNVTHLGTVTTGDECRSIASGEIDVSTDVGKLIQQMADEINGLSRSLEAARRLQGTDVNRISSAAEKSAIVRLKTDIAPSDTVLPRSLVLIQWDGIAGDPYSPYFVFYQAPPHQYLSSWEVIGLVNCFFKSPPVIADYENFDPNKPDGLQFFPDAAHGTPIGTRYTGAIKLSVVLVQETT
jgi:hypothetical protein